MARTTIFIICCFLAAIAPFLTAKNQPTQNAAVNFPAFPTEFEGLPLKELELSDFEKRFFADFPGKAGRFSDGRREIIFRRVTEATRKLHPASDCFAAIGYKTKPLPIRVDERGNHWGCFAATRNGESLRVCERIHSEKTAESWTDVSAWYWSALGDVGNEWQAVTTAETIN